MDVLQDGVEWYPAQPHRSPVRLGGRHLRKSIEMWSLSSSTKAGLTIAPETNIILARL
jgi:hypothetical protein